MPKKITKPTKQTKAKTQKLTAKKAALVKEHLKTSLQKKLTKQKENKKPINLEIKGTSIKIHKAPLPKIASLANASRWNALATRMINDDQIRKIGDLTNLLSPYLLKVHGKNPKWKGLKR